MYKKESTSSKNVKGLWFLCLLGFSVTYYWFLIKSDVNYSPMMGNTFSQASLMSILLISIFVFMKYYCAWWYKINPSSKALIIYEKIFIPVGAILYPIGLLNIIISGSEFSVGTIITSTVTLYGFVSFIVLIYMLYDLNYTVRLNVLSSSDFSINRSTTLYHELLFSNFPPIRRRDLLPLDFIVNVIVFFPIILL